MHCVVCHSPYQPGDTFCQTCGARIAPGAAFAATAAAPALALAPPVPYQAEGLLVVPRNASLPPLCVKCGHPAQFIADRYTWVHPALYLLFLLGALPAAIVIMIVQKKFELPTPLCPEHIQQRKTRLWVGLSLLILCIPAGMAVGIVPKDPDAVLYGMLLGFFMFIAGAVFLSLRMPMRPKRIDDYMGKFRVSPEFLIQIPMRDPNQP
jgi:hypothetical protein